MIINKKIGRTIRENKSQYLGSLVLIIISCMLYTMFNQLSNNMNYLKDTFEKKYVQEDANFAVDKSINNVKFLEEKFKLKLERFSSFDYTVSKGKTLRIFSQNNKVDIPAITEGSKLKEGYIILDPAYAKANKLSIGKDVKIFKKSYKISGFMSLPNYIYPLKAESDIISDPKYFGIGVLTKRDYRSIHKEVNFYTVKFMGKDGDIRKRTNELKGYLRAKNIIILKWTGINENPRVTYVDAKMDGISSMSSSMPVAILLLTCILTGIVMWRMLKREAVIIGTLYALGYRKREIVKHYISYPLLIAILGGIIGTALGALTLRPMLYFMIQYFNIPVSSIDFNWVYVLISILLPIVFLGISGYVVCVKALKASPVDLMRGGKEKTKVGFLEKSLRLDRLKFSTKFKLREQLRSIPRSVFLILGVALATVLLLYGFAAQSSMDYFMKDAYEKSFKYQYEYVYNSLHDRKISFGEEFSLSSFSLKGDKKVAFSVYGVNPKTKYIYLKDKEGDKISMDKVVITRPLADRLKVKKGDNIRLINRLDSRQYNIAIDKIAETFSGESIYIPLERFNKMLHYPVKSYIGIWSDKKLNIRDTELLSSKSIADAKKGFDSVTKPLRSTIGVIAFMSFIIGLIVIYVVTSLIIEENKDNISLMKVLGYRKKEVYSLILNSSTFLVILGFILGIPVLFTTLKAMFASATKSMNFTFPVKIDYSYLVIGFLVIYFTYEISKALSKKKVNKISMVEALKGRGE